MDTEIEMGNGYERMSRTGKKERKKKGWGLRD